MSGLILNHDNSHFFLKRKVEELSDNIINEVVNEYTNTQVKEMYFCTNCMKASYESKVFEPVWKGYDPAMGSEQPLFDSLSENEKPAMENFIKSAYHLSRDGKNVYKQWIEQCRKVNISPWISVRMNDVHCVNNEQHPLHCSLWKSRPELRRIPYRFQRWTDKAFDYANEEVREYFYQFIKENLELYDIDGIELDWMRFGYHFKLGFEQEGVLILNDFMRKIKKLVQEFEQKRGHVIKITPRVPSRPATALGLGMDAVKWARESLIDEMVITPFWETSETDMPIEIWKQLLDGTNVKLNVGLEILLRAYPSARPIQCNSLETARGMALSYLCRGVDKIYLYNYFEHDEFSSREQYVQLLNELGSIEAMRGKSRRHIVTYSDTWAPGEAAGYLLPARIGKNDAKTFRIHIGEKPDNQEAEIFIGCKEAEGVEVRNFEVYLNEALCAVNGRKSVSDFVGKKVSEFPCTSENLYSFKVPANALHDGYNVIEVYGEECTLNWVEIYINERND